MSKTLKKNGLLIGMAMLAMLDIADILYHKTIEIGFMDLQLYWEEFRVTLLGYDTGYYYHMGERVPGSGYLPAIPIFPWGRILGNLLCPSFLPFGIAKWYTFVLLVVLCAVIGWMGSSYIRQRLGLTEKLNATSLFFKVSFCFIFIMPFYWRDMIYFFNIGGVICFLLLLIIFIVDEHPYAAALLLAVSMMKPQNAVPFVIILLLEKKWKTVFTAAGIDVVAWIFTAVWTGVNPMQQVLYISGRSTVAEPYYFWFGLLDPLRKLGINSNVAMVCGMALGVVILLFLYLMVKKNSALSDNVIAVYAGAAVISTVWMYKSKSDFVVVVLASMLVLQYYLMENTSETGTGAGVTLRCLVILALLNVLNFTEFGRILFGYTFTTGMTLDGWCRTLAVIWVTILCRKSAEKVEEYYAINRGK